VEFAVEQTFPAPAPRVLEVYVDPAFYANLTGLSNLTPVEVVSFARSDDHVDISVRYRFSAPLPGPVSAFIDTGRITWVEHSAVDLASRTATITAVPDHYRDRLDMRPARVSFAEPSAGRTSRRIKGDISIKGLPFFLRSPVEGAIVSGMRDHFAEEQQAVVAWLS
jgi:hypothetical protein